MHKAEFNVFEEEFLNRNKEERLNSTKKQNNIISSYDTTSTENIKEIRTENVQAYIQQAGGIFKFDTPDLYDSQINVLMMISKRLSLLFL